MMRSFLAGTCGLVLLGLSATCLHAQQASPATAGNGTGTDAGMESGGAAGAGEPSAAVDFEGGRLTITQQEEYGEKTLAYDGKELARNYYIAIERVVKVAGANVALVSAGDGGNACGPAEVLVWKPQGGAIRSLTVGEDDCGAPPAAVTDNAIYFVPYVLPGQARQALQWSPEGGLTTLGRISYMPDPGTSWGDVDGSKYGHILDAFHNEAVYRAAAKLIGKSMTEMVTSLLVGGAPETAASGIFYAGGCVPHNCGGNDGFMAVDAARRAVYFARQGDDGRPESWPSMRSWPRAVREAYRKAKN